MTPWVRIGTIGKAHGLRGAFFVSGRDEPIPSTIKIILIGKSPEDSKKSNLLSRSTGAGNSEVLRCDAALDRTAIESLQGQALWVHRDELGLEDEGDCLRTDLIGKQVMDSRGSMVGTIDNIYNCGASDIATITNGNKGVDIPIVATYFDMNFSADSPQLQLTVTSDVFDDLWEELKGR